MSGDLSRTLGDEYVHQMADADPVETQEWLDSLDAVVGEQGPDRAKYLVAKLLERAHENNVGIAGAITTPYINTIPPEEEPEFPGDAVIERRIRRFIRWNAAVMVIKANHRSKGIGGHLSTFASSASASTTSSGARTPRAAVTTSTCRVMPPPESMPEPSWRGDSTRSIWTTSDSR
jgi:hypothetical protein